MDEKKEEKRRLNQVAVRLEPDLYAEVKSLARKDGRAVSDYIRHLLKLHVDAQNKSASKAMARDRGLMNPPRHPAR
jgi:hypothetical protein